MSVSRLRGQRGFTLIELLLALAAGLVVAASALALVVTSLHLSSTYTDRVNANQVGRTAMEKIVQALRSSCVASAVPPVLSGSDDTNAIFYSVLAAQPTVSPNEIKVSLSGGQLVMYTYAYASGSSPNWTFATTPTSFVLVAHAAQTVNGSTTLPVFRYYGYNSSGDLSSTPFTTPLSTANAAATAMVTVSYQALPDNGNSALHRGVDLTDSVVMRLSPASTSVANGTSPCA